MEIDNIMIILSEAKTYYKDYDDKIVPDVKKESTSMKRKPKIRNIGI